MWHAAIEEPSSTAAYCGNGSLIGVWIGKESKRPPRTIVLDSNSGMVRRVIEGQSRVSHPFADTRVLMNTGEILDLADGALSEGVSKAAWWRSIGL